jgi:hypothetical protein
MKRFVVKYVSWSLGEISITLPLECIPDGPPVFCVKTDGLLKRRLIPLRALLHIEDMFDNITLTSRHKATEEHGVEQGIVR